MNGRPLFLRGTLECQVFPLTGYPPMRRGAVAADFPDQKILRAEFHSLSFVVSAGRGVRGRRPRRHHDSGRGAASERAAPDPTRARCIHRGGAAADDPHLRQSSVVLPDDARQRIRRQGELLTRWVDMLIREDPRHLYSSASCAENDPNRQWTEETFGRGIHGPGTTARRARRHRARNRPAGRPRNRAVGVLPEFRRDEEIHRRHAAEELRDRSATI